MRKILILAACVLLASCSARSVLATPLELFGGHKLAIDLGLKDANDPHIHAKLDTFHHDVVTSDEFKAACSAAAYVVYETQKPTWVGVAQTIVK